MINYFGYVFNYFFVIKLKFIMWVCGWMNVEKKITKWFGDESMYVFKFK